MYRFIAPLLVLFASYTSTALADEVWAFTSYKHPFTGVQVLREAGYEVHVLLVDLNEQAMDGIRSSVKVQKGMSQDALRELSEEISDTIDLSVIEKALKSDIATRVLAKKMGVKSIPAVVRYDRGGMTVQYGELDIVQASRQLGFVR